MNRKFFFLFVVVMVSSRSTNVGAIPSFWDGIPIISQVKSLLQVMTGDTDGASKTQENFINQAPIVSQVKSVVESISGNDESALNTQKKFLNEFIEPVVDNTPIVGHIKGGIHLAVGDTERGQQILKDASSSTGAVIGGIIGGPGGAIAGVMAADSVITGIDSTVNKDFKPYGVVDYAGNIGKKSIGDHFDHWVDISQPLVPKIGKGKSSNQKRRRTVYRMDRNNVM